MKVISLTQPWAQLIAVGAKRIETRGWSTSYRGPIAIHASKGFPGEAKRLCEARSVCQALGWPGCPETLTQEWLDDSARRIKALPLGAIIATANLIDCQPTELLLANLTDEEERFGNYEPRRFGFLLENVVQLSAPVPAKGSLRLWEWDGPK